MEYDENDELIYETDKSGEKMLVRSIESVHPVYIRFINRVSRPVDVWWRDFQGRRRHYIRIDAKSFFSIDTYVTHPWEFTDPATNENYLINNKMIFRPPRELAGVRHRSSWIISVCIRTLRSTVMLSLAQHLNDRRKVPDLGLPRELEFDLEQLIGTIQRTPPPPPHRA